MAEDRAYVVMIDSESSKPRTQFDVEKFDSDPWAKKNMAWDSEVAGINSVSVIKAILDNARDTKLLTVQFKTTSDTKVYQMLAVANKMKRKPADKEGVLDYLQLNVVHDGTRYSILFKEPVIDFYKPVKENKINYVIFSVKTKSEPKRDGGPI